MNELSKINAYNKIPKSLLDYKNNYESYQSNSIRKPNTNRDIIHRKSNSIDTNSILEIHQMKILTNNTEQISEEENIFTHFKNLKTNNLLNEQISNNPYVDDKNKDRRDDSYYKPKRSNNGLQSERSTNNKALVDNSLIMKELKYKVKSRYTSEDHTRRSVKEDNIQSIFPNNIQGTKQNLKINLIKNFDSNNNKVKEKHSSSINSENKKINSLNNLPNNKSQMSNGSKTIPKTFDRLDIMYSKGLEKFEKFKKLNEEQIIIKIKQEIAECTFKPKLNKYYPSKQTVNKIRDIPIHERQKLWNEKKFEK